MDVLLSVLANISPASLAPAQHDINIAVLAVILGGVLVGYEKAARGRAATHNKRRANQS